MTDTQQADRLETFDKLLDKSRTVMFTTVAEGGKVLSRPMTVQEVTDDHELVFITQAHTDVAKQSDGNQVNVSVAGDDYWISLSGTASVAEEPETKKRLWNTFNDAYTDGGPENPDNVVLRVDADSAEYWDTPGGVGVLLGVLKAQLTGGKPESGENATVQL
jgi:general stress protein 26